MKKKTVYLSIDVETDGPIPGMYSMLSFGVAAMDITGAVLDTFSVNLELLDDACENADTMKWWKQRWHLYEETRKDAVHPSQAMQDYVTWQKQLRKDHDCKLAYIGYPIVFDQMFVYWYAIKFTGKDYAGFSGADIKSYASAALKKPYKEVNKRDMPARWKSESKHTHIAIDDAIEQGKLGMAILRELGIE